MSELYPADDDDWKDSPLVKLILATLSGAVTSKTIKKVTNKIKAQVNQVDLNKLMEDPKAEIKALGDRLKDEGKKSVENTKDEVAYMKKKGIGGLIGDWYKEQKARFRDSLTGMVAGKYALSADLKVEGINAIIGEYLNDSRPILREDADQVRNFAYHVLHDAEVLPQDLGYGEDNPEVRTELVTDFVGFATTDVDYMLSILKKATSIDEVVFKDEDPTLRRNEFTALTQYADQLREVAEMYNQKEGE